MSLLIIACVVLLITTIIYTFKYNVKVKELKDLKTNSATTIRLEKSLNKDLTEGKNTLLKKVSELENSTIPLLSKETEKFKNQAKSLEESIVKLKTSYSEKLKENITYAKENKDLLEEVKSLKLANDTSVKAVAPEVLKVKETEPVVRKEVEKTKEVKITPAVINTPKPKDKIETKPQLKEAVKKKRAYRKRK